MFPGLAFEVDCGEVLAGHRLLATGLRVDGMSDDAVHADYSDHRPGKPAHTMVSLTYVIAPALDPAGVRGRDVDAEVRIEPPADPTWWEPVTSGAGERDASPDQAVTRGAFGPFVVPDGTRTVTAVLADVGLTTDGVPPEDDSPERPRGTLRIDLETASARWLDA